MNHRTEIDGLRAIAVLPVIFYHAGITFFSGGYVGVDIFFVISGYLITSLIFKETQEKSFSLLTFYERRARRLLPALFLVLFFSLLISWLILMPLDLDKFSRSLFSVSIFSSNILFWFEEGYFNTASEFKPLLHTWSLAVEEQFYIVFPLLMIVLAGIKKRKISLILSFLFVLSLLASEYFLSYDKGASFYLLPFRGWELLAGSLLALHLINNKIKNSNYLSFIGCIFIFYSIIFFDEETNFPGFNALFPVIGTSLIILFSGPKTFVNKILSSNFLVFIGLISYSSYLFHQPIFAFSRYLSYDDLNIIEILFLIFISLFLGFVSWKFVEKPFRNRRNLSRKSIFTLSILISIFFGSVGLLGYFKDGFPERNPNNLVYENFGHKIQEVGLDCLEIDSDAVKEFARDFCKFGNLNSTKKILVYGDSHGKVLISALNDIFKKNGLSGEYLSLKDCQLIPNSVRADLMKKNEKLCYENFKKLTNYIDKEISTTIFISRWTFRSYPVEDHVQQLRFGHQIGFKTYEGYRRYASRINSENRFDYKSKSHSIEDAINKLSENKPLILVSPIPEIGANIAKINFFEYQKTGNVPDKLSYPYKYYEERNRFINNIFSEIEKENNNVSLIKSGEIFCKNIVKDECIYQINKKPLYYDNNHLSHLGAEILMNELINKMKGTF